MNDINVDLEWTVELEEDFESKEKGEENRKERRGIPTLDFEVYWEGKENRFKYRYYEKEMRNPVVIQRRSAMNKNQKYGILSQELIRRLSNISEGGGGRTERETVGSRIVHKTAETVWV